MSSPAQIAANVLNAQSSPGPRTEEGRAASSKNAITHGLYAAGDFIRPTEQPKYDQLNAALLTDLLPVGVLEHTLVNEIRRATWRLRRCGQVESRLIFRLDTGNGYIFDAMETTDAAAQKIQNSVNRARAQAQRHLHKCTAELRRLQTCRHYAQELFFNGVDTVGTGIADWQAVGKANNAPTRVSVAATSPVAPADVTITERTQSPAEELVLTPRNAPCACGSGQKFKRCCGRGAPAVLHAA